MLLPEEKKNRQKKRLQKIYNEQHKIINGILYKKCNKHMINFPDEDEWFPCTEEYFYKNKLNGLDRLFPNCIKCERKKAREHRRNNKKECKIIDAEYYKKNKNIIKKRVVKYQSDKKEHYKNMAKNWRKNNKQIIKKYNNRYSNKKHDISKKEWESCKEYFNNSCAYCGISEKDAKKEQGQNLHKEHVDYNGANNLSNCIPACKRCNTSKHTKDMEIWFRNKDFFLEERLNKINKWINEDYKLYIKEDSPYIVNN